MSLALLGGSEFAYVFKFGTNILQIFQKAFKKLGVTNDASSFVVWFFFQLSESSV